MQISVIVMPLTSGTGYKARVGEPWNVVTDAGDPDTAFALLDKELRPRIPTGADLVRVDVPVYDRLFDVVGGLDPNSPIWAHWAEDVERLRAAGPMVDGQA